MPINLQNHRTSNAKLFSVSSNKQKLHTAASLKESQKNNLKVRKNDSGSGFAMMTRMFANPTNATPNLPVEIPERNCRQRRHSISSNGNARTPDHSPAPSLRHSTNSTPPQLALARSSSRGEARSKIKRSGSLDHTLVFQQQQAKEQQPSTSTPTTKKTRPRRSKSFGNPSQGPVIKSLSQSPRSRKLSPRRGSGDTSKSLNQCPPSPRDTLRAKREQMRRKSHGSISTIGILNKTPASLLGDDDNDSVSDDSLLSGDS